MSRHGQPHAQSTPETALDALLAAERDAALRLDRAREEAAAIISAAQADVVALTEGTRVALAREREQLEHAQRLALSDIERSVAQSASDALARYQGLSDATVHVLARLILSETSGLPLVSP